MVFLISSLSSALLCINGCVIEEPPTIIQYDGNGQCYWMENYSGNYHWLPAESVLLMPHAISKSYCYQLDSCDGGLGRSGGGCYKWALGAEQARIPWHIPNKPLSLQQQ